MGGCLYLLFVISALTVSYKGGASVSDSGRYVFMAEVIIVALWILSYWTTITRYLGSDARPKKAVTYTDMALHAVKGIAFVIVYSFSYHKGDPMWTRGYVGSALGANVALLVSLCVCGALRMWLTYRQNPVDRILAYSNSQFTASALNDSSILDEIEKRYREEYSEDMFGGEMVDGL